MWIVNVVVCMCACTQPHTCVGICVGTPSTWEASRDKHMRVLCVSQCVCIAIYVWMGICARDCVRRAFMSVQFCGQGECAGKCGGGGGGDAVMHMCVRVPCAHMHKHVLVRKRGRMGRRPMYEHTQGAAHAHHSTDLQEVAPIRPQQRDVFRDHTRACCAREPVVVSCKLWCGGGRLVQRGEFWWVS